MASKPILHFIDASSRNRAELARAGFALGHHCEVYADLGELALHPPRDGIIIVRDWGEEGNFKHTAQQLQQLGVWLPLIAFDEAPRINRIVAAISAGALDYLAFPLDHGKLADAIERARQEAEVNNEARRRKIAARTLVSKLSRREGEVLDWLAEGYSNKAIAHELQISPRTVEIHRANMMAKLGARHAAEAVRIRIEAQLDEPQESHEGRERLEPQGPIVNAQRQ
ncbi:MAG: helix-turn-helix transcriptional regulator [Alphaproteobacteria bacterium]|nr:MAG: helix-turn-helix transcriptional regulator [Alphaproteobacteria bacterium]